MLGPEHPDTLHVHEQSGRHLLRQGKYAQAEALYNQTLETRLRVLGPEHPDTLASMNNLANIYCDQRASTRRPKRSTRQTLEIQRRVLGPEHPYTLSLLSNMAGMYQRQDKFDKAETYAAQSLAGQRHSLGPENQRVLVPLNRPAEDFDRFEIVRARVTSYSAIIIPEAAERPPPAQSLRARFSLCRHSDWIVRPGAFQFLFDPFQAVRLVQVSELYTQPINDPLGFVQIRFGRAYSFQC